jgi:hypothetical protein
MSTLSAPPLVSLAIISTQKTTILPPPVWGEAPTFPPRNDSTHLPSSYTPSQRTRRVPASSLSEPHPNTHHRPKGDEVKLQLTPLRTQQNNGVCYEHGVSSFSFFFFKCLNPCNDVIQCDRTRAALKRHSVCAGVLRALGRTSGGLLWGVGGGGAGRGVGESGGWWLAWSAV